MPKIWSAKEGGKGLICDDGRRITTEKKRNKVRRKRLRDEWLTELIVRFGLLPKLNATGLVHMGQYQARYPRNTSRRS